MHTTTAAQRCLCASLLILALASCGGSGSDRPDAGRANGTELSTTTSTASPNTSITVSDAQTAVIEAYRQFDAMVNTYGRETGPFDANDLRTRLQLVATNGEFDQLFERLQINRLKGWVYRGGETDQHRPVVRELSSQRAVLTDCADDTGGIYDTRQNQFVEPLTPGAKTFSRVVLTLDGSAWKVAAVTVQGSQCE